MTYRRADRLGWPRLRAQRFVIQRIDDARVTGYATLLHMLEVAEPLWVTHHEQRICIADAGYSWLQIFPESANYTHTTMFDPEGQPVQEYIDLVAEQGIGDDGIPWYDDLYLDITWIPEGAPLLLDQEELEAAHAIGAITPEQYDLARGETARMLVALTLGDYTLPEVTRSCYPILRAALEESANAPGGSAPTVASASTVAPTADDVAAATTTPEPSENVAADNIPDMRDAEAIDTSEAPEPPDSREVTQTEAEAPAPDATVAVAARDHEDTEDIERVERSGEDDEQHA